MPRYRVAAPNGGFYDVTAPDGVSQDDVLAYVRQQFASQRPNSSDPPMSQPAPYPQSRAPRLSELPLPIRDGAGGVRWMTPDELGLPADFSHLPRRMNRQQMPAASPAALPIPSAPFVPTQPPSGDVGLLPRPAQSSLGLLGYAGGGPQNAASGGLLSFPPIGTSQTGPTATGTPAAEGDISRLLARGAAPVPSSQGRVEPTRYVPDGKGGQTFVPDWTGIPDLSPGYRGGGVVIPPFRGYGQWRTDVPYYIVNPKTGERTLVLPNKGTLPGSDLDNNRIPDSVQPGNPDGAYFEPWYGS